MPAQVIATRLQHSAIARLCQAARALPIRLHALSLADQAVVSGASFAMTIVVGRFTTSADLGLYAIGMSVLVSVTAVQDSLISLPYTIDHGSGSDRPAARLGAAIAQSGLLSGLLLVVASLAAPWGPLNDMMRAAPGLGWLAVAVPVVLMKDLARRQAFADMAFDRALRLDMGAAALQGAVFFGLTRLAPIGLATPFIAVAASSALVVLFWLASMRRAISMSLTDVAVCSRRNWLLGRWLFASQLTVVVQGFASNWLVLWLLGAAYAGIYAACMTVVLFVNPIITGLGNVLAPRAAHCLSQHGPVALRRQAAVDALLIFVAIGTFCLMIATYGESFLAYAFPNQAYQRYGPSTFILATGILAAAVGMPASNALAVIRQPHWIFAAGLLGAVVTVAASWLLAARYGVSGAAGGFAFGHAAGAGARWMALLRSVHVRGHRHGPLQDVLSTLSRFHFTEVQQIEKLGQGEEAIVYRLRFPPPAQPQVVKVFRQGGTDTVSRVRVQASRLDELYAALDGRSFAGWRVHIPRPLQVGADPASLVMTAVPGMPLCRCLEPRNPDPETEFRSLTHALADAMGCCWSQGLIHGDFNLDNILVGGATRCIALVDPGEPSPRPGTGTRLSAFQAASDDFGYLVFNEISMLRRLMLRPGYRRRRRAFVRAVMLAYLQSCDAPRDARGFLDAVAACARDHLALLRPSLSPRGFWLAALRIIAERSLRQTIAQVEENLPLPESVLIPVRHTGAAP